MSLTSLGVASDGLLSRGDNAALHIAVRGLLRGGEGGSTGGGSNDPHKYGLYRKQRVGFGQGIALLNARAVAVKEELDAKPVLRKAVFKAVVEAAKEIEVAPFDVTENTIRGEAFNDLVKGKVNSQVELAPAIEPELSIDEIIRWFEWVQRMEDEEDMATLLLMI